MKVKDRVRRKEKWVFKRKTKWSEWVSECGRRRDGVRKCLTIFWASLLLLGSLAPSSSLFFLFLLSLLFSSGSSQFVLSDRSTAGKWQAYKETHTHTHPHTHTHTHTRSHTGRGGLKEQQWIIQAGDSVLRSTLWFLLCFVYACMREWVDGLAAHAPF